MKEHKGYLDAAYKVNTFYKKYVCMPNIEIPTILLKSPKYFAPLLLKKILTKLQKVNQIFEKVFQSN